MSAGNIPYQRRPDGERSLYCYRCDLQQTRAERITSAPCACGSAVFYEVRRPPALWANKYANALPESLEGLAEFIRQEERAVRRRGTK